MTPGEILEETESALNLLRSHRNDASAHHAADEILLKFISDMGYPSVSKVYESLADHHGFRCD